MSERSERAVGSARALVRRAMRTVSVRRQVRRLARSSEPAVERLADALRDAAANRFDRGARTRFARIEALRDELSASTERVEVHDFGAGLPTSTRTAVEMVRGTVSSPEVGRLAATASLPPQLGRLLHAVVAATGARRGIELGTCLGISAAYQVAALDDRDGAEFVTCEGAPALAALAERNLERLGLRRCRVVTGRFGDTLPDLAASLAPLDYAFVDGHHDEQATIDYFELLRPSLATGAVVVFDDIRWSPGWSVPGRRYAPRPACSPTSNSVDSVSSSPVPVVEACGRPRRRTQRPDRTARRAGRRTAVAA